MTSAEKAVQTRRRNKLKQEARLRQVTREKEAIRKGCVEVLESEGMTPDQKLEASRLLLRAMSSNPYEFF